MPYRTLAHGEVGSSELKIWFVSDSPLPEPESFIRAAWDEATDLTTTFRDVEPVSFELNEPVPDGTPEGFDGQAIYRTDHGLYSYDLVDGEWDRRVKRPDIRLEY